MDPLTHTLVGANLAATRLGRTTGLATAACVIGANLPDVDAILYLTDYSDLALGFRRGWTHGVLALVVLPFVQTALLMAYARWRRIDVSGRWLLILSAISIATHPVLDWLNTYGMRFLMPFDGRWFYGDSVYIMDPWLWLILGVGFLTGKRANWWSVAAWLIVTLLIARMVVRRSPEYLVVVAIVAVILLIAMLWRPPARSLAPVALIFAVLYIGGRLLLHAYVVRQVAPVMAGPHPLHPLRWNVVMRAGDEYRYGTYDFRRLTLTADRAPVAKDSPEWRAAQRDPSVRGFMTWTRFPSYTIDRSGGETRVLLYDARRPPSGRSSRVVVIGGESR